MNNKAKVLILCLLAFLIPRMLKAQIQFQWVTGLPWKDNGISSVGIVGDAEGSIIYASTFLDTFTFNSTFHQAAGPTAAGPDIVLAKISNAGVIQWVKTAGGHGMDNVYSVCTDSQGNIYITGDLRDTAYFDGDTVLNTGISSCFYLAKYNPLGNMLWVRTSTGYQGSGARVKCDQNDDVIVIGSFCAWVNFDTTHITLINPSDCGTYLIKFDGNGNFIWMKGAKSVFLNDFGFTAQDDIIAYGTSHITSAVNWGNDNQLNAYFYPFGNTESDITAVKLDAAGNLLWHFSEGGTDEVHGERIVVYPDGSFGTSGDFVGTATIAGQTVIGDNLYRAYFAAFYDSAHAGRWLKPVQMNPVSAFHFLVIFKSGNLMLTYLAYSNAANISCQYSNINFPASIYKAVNVGSCDTAGVYLPFVRDTMISPYTYGPYAFYTSAAGTTFMTGAVNNSFIFNSGDTITSVNGYYTRFVAKLDNNFITSSNSYALDNEGINIYPNPSSGHVFIDSKIHKKLIASVYSVTGEKIMDAPIDGYGMLSLPNNTGIYILKIEGENFIAVRKIVKL